MAQIAWTTVSGPLPSQPFGGSLCPLQTCNWQLSNLDFNPNVTRIKKRSEFNSHHRTEADQRQTMLLAPSISSHGASADRGSASAQAIPLRLLWLQQQSLQPAALAVDNTLHSSCSGSFSLVKHLLSVNSVYSDTHEGGRLYDPRSSPWLLKTLNLVSRTCAQHSFSSSQMQPSNLGLRESIS